MRARERPTVTIRLRDGESLKGQAKAVPIVRVAQELRADRPDRFRLHQTGNTWRAHCLDGHEDTDPSLNLWTAKNLWTCFSCGDRGDTIELVCRVLGCGFPEALTWIKERFKLAGDVRSATDPVAQWATIRGLPVESVWAFAPEVRREKGHDVLRFPRRSIPEGEIRAYQKRRADDRPITGTKRSISEGPMEGLFFPQDWPPVKDDSILVIAEGAPDAIAAHAAGFRHTAGTPGKNWFTGVIGPLREVAAQFKEKVLVLDGDVPDHGDDGLFARAALLQAVPVRVPPRVAGERTQRDLNKWLAKTGAADVSWRIRSELSSSVPFTAIRQDAIPSLRALAAEHGGGLQRRHYAIHDCLASFLLQGLSAFHHRGEVRGVTVGPQEFVTSFPRLAEQAGCSNRAAETILRKWRMAEVLDWEAVRGRNGTPGILITWHNLSEYVRVTPTVYDSFLRSKPAPGSDLS